MNAIKRVLIIGAMYTYAIMGFRILVEEDAAIPAILYGAISIWLYFYSCRIGKENEQRTE